jgi:YHS domain-containing protein
MSFFRVIFFIFLFYLLYSFLKKIFKSLFKEKDREFQKSSRKLSEKELVKDPQCGIYVVKNPTFTLKNGGETIYFCSKECMDQYKKKRIR